MKKKKIKSKVEALDKVTTTQFETEMLEKYEVISDDMILKSNVDELARIIEKYYIKFYQAVINVSEEEKLKQPLERFKSFSKLLINTLRIWDVDGFGNKEKILQASIYLGSLLEGVLQLFLLVFETDYLNAHWKEWLTENDGKPDFKFIRSKIDNVLSELVKEKYISKKQKDNVKKVILDELKYRDQGRQIQKIMLNELISLFEHEKILYPYTYINDVVVQDEIKGKIITEKMNKIREGRNSIHIFTDCSTSSEEDVIERIRDYCFIMKSLLFRVRSCNEQDKKNVYLESIIEKLGDNALILIDR